MHDEQIILLYWNRDETAIAATEEKYERSLLKIAYNILHDREDSRESVNDTYFKAWNSIPPHCPDILSAFLSKITRETSIDLLRRQTREKRGGSQYTQSLSELEECISTGNTTEQSVDLHLLAETIGNYLRILPPEPRNLFVGRYYFMDSIKEIAGYYGMSESKVKTTLHRTRKGLKQYLIEEGFDL